MEKELPYEKESWGKNKMNEKILWMSIFVPISAFLVNGWNYYGQLPSDDYEKNDNVTSKLNKTNLYCYHFTWMGPKFNKWTFKNIRHKTCSQYFKDKKTLCINPMVATEKGGKPDIDYILNNHAEDATCRLSQEHVCVKYTVYYNGIISYESRYCTIVNIDLEGPMQKGCIQEKRGSQIIEVCACKSQPGSEGICNSGSRAFRIGPIGLTVLVHLINFLFLILW